MGIINYTKEFGILSSALSRKSGINPNMKKKVSNGFGLLPGSVISTNNFKNGTVVKNQSRLRIFKGDGNSLSGRSTLKSGGLMDRLIFNTGAGAKMARNSGTDIEKTRLSTKSKLGTAVAAAGGGIIGGKLMGNYAKSKAETEALNKGLKPGTPEYEKFIKEKTRVGKNIGRVGGALVGGAAKRLLGKNTFVAK